MEQFFYSLTGLRWQDVLDILLNSYILFRLYVLFRGTRVIRALQAVIIFWAAGQAAVSLGLIITNWAMQGVITVAAIIIIVVFRNEISSVLLTKDLKSFLWGIPKYQFKTPVHIIAETVFDLAPRKIGALIILPSKQDIASMVQGGISIEAKLSQELLTSIFWGENPLHDGAVVIQGDRIKSAGEILPLSKRQDLPSSFGTRHRAGLGLSELTDAMVIVVSEERGVVTLFKKDQIHTIRSRSALEKKLREHAGDGPSKKGFQHPSVKITAAAAICLFCITGLWFSFSKGMEAFATHEIPVEFINPNQRMEIVSTSASNVKLVISGAKPLLNTVRPEMIDVKLNLSKAVVGTNTVLINKENIMLPPGVRLRTVSPPELEVSLDTLMVKELPVQPHWTGNLPDGLIMKQARAIPPMVRVTGRGLILKEIHTVYTESLPLDKLTDSGQLETNLVLENPSLSLNTGRKIQVEYQIVKKPG